MQYPFLQVRFLLCQEAPTLLRFSAVVDQHFTPAVFSDIIAALVLSALPKNKFRRAAKIKVVHELLPALLILFSVSLYPFWPFQAFL